MPPPRRSAGFGRKTVTVTQLSQTGAIPSDFPVFPQKCPGAWTHRGISYPKKKRLEAIAWKETEVKNFVSILVASVLVAVVVASAFAGETKAECEKSGKRWDSKTNTCYSANGY